MAKVGFIGLGIMGRPMVKNLLQSGVEVMVCDRNRETIQDLAVLGASSGSNAEIGRSCEVIFTMLPDGNIVQQVLFENGGVASTLQEGSIVCDMSSVTPEESRTCYKRLKNLGVGFVDAPVSGGEPGAKDGTLAILCGGDSEDIERLMPYFEILGSSAIRVGASGAGSVTKLANQIIVNLNIAALSEALVLAVKCGADPEIVCRAIRGGLAGSAVLESKAAMIYERNFRPGGKLSINRKDLKNVLATGRMAEVPLPLSAQLFELMQSLCVAGHSDEDHAAIVRYFERLANVEVRKREELVL